jgi:hypothetical protein
VSHVVLTLLTFASFINIHASYHIGPNAVDFEGTASFTEANYCNNMLLVTSGLDPHMISWLWLLVLFSDGCGLVMDG